ncbi:ubiquinol-cytochrome c reductase iron-sulfur subunit [Aureibacillus halotolerans]|uniref:Menaquinol:cytochrome c reductase iron-sulfur subunit n=1 Tax=Aureibacillus halotolerans TaxID=1508390 RepID=A0A4R6U6X7_9BACI|nr:ubiquinol-cytochrome c reductase iron-sulfur subunit [Aureibacillus halotolerans]TDQ41516.1 menaquinol-cytochrome c reductase iron-sulfur subunit [Aureibacillus halotolerans]
MSEEKEHRVSRRQFLNYTLTGVGGFMAAGMLMPMIRFAIDPVLQSQGESELVPVMDVSEITTTPQSVNFPVDQVDGWYESTVDNQALIFKDENGDVHAFSSLCKHLGCGVSWASNPAYPDQFFCPCHGGRYYKDGRNVPGTPPTAGLDVYQQEIRDGKLYLGRAVPRGGV